MADNSNIITSSLKEVKLLNEGSTPSPTAGFVSDFLL
jgi:hypothetical protein